MPYRSLATLEAWVAEFESLGYEIEVSIRVMQQDGVEGANSGLVGVHLSDAATVIYIQPEATGSPKWVVTMEPREQVAVLNSAEVLNMSSQLAMISALCAFLQAKSAVAASESD